MFVKLYLITKLQDMNITELNLTERSKMVGKRDGQLCLVCIFQCKEHYFLGKVGRDHFDGVDLLHYSAYKWKALSFH